MLAQPRPRLSLPSNLAPNRRLVTYNLRNDRWSGRVGFKVKVMVSENRKKSNFATSSVDESSEKRNRHWHESAHEISQNVMTWSGMTLREHSCARCWVLDGMIFRGNL